MADDIWKNDFLGRDKDAEFLYRLAIGRNEENVRNNKGSFVLNIDAAWGQGKSFFLNAVYETVKARKHPAVFINAWQYDFVDDPFAICVAALDRYFKSIQEQKEITKTEKFQKGLKTVRSQFLNITWTLGKAVVKKAINKVAENGVEEVASIFDANENTNGGEKNFADEMAEAITEEMKLFSDAAIDKFAQRQIDTINETQESLTIFQKGLGLIIEAIGESKKHELPMFIFIDELDRCRPTYAISMLERIKHIFDVPNVVFVLATDTESLGHSIKAVYGNEFKSREYLGRFFNRTYILPSASTSTIILSMLQERGTDVRRWSFLTDNQSLQDASVFLDLTAGVFNLEIRPTKQAVEILMDITSAWDGKLPIELTYLFCFICYFVKTGKINATDMNAVINTNSQHWRAMARQQQVKYRDVLTKVAGLAKISVREGLNEADVAISNQGNVVNRYIFDLMRKEYEHAQSTNTLERAPTFANYAEMILHSRNLS